MCTQDIKWRWNNNSNKIDKSINQGCISVFPEGPALCQMQCHHSPARGCLLPKWMSGRSRQLWKRNRLDSKRWRWPCCLNQSGCKLKDALVLPVCLNSSFSLTQEQRLKELSKRPSFAATDTSPISTTGGTISTAPSIDLFSTPSCSNG